MVDLGSLVLLVSIFGAKVAIIYVVLGLVIAVIGGTIIEKLHMESNLSRVFFTKTTCETTRRVTRMFRLQSAIYRR